MPIKHIAVACQGGGSHAAYAAGALPVLLPQFHNAELAAGKLHPGLDGDLLQLAGISGTSGGAISALLAWYGFLLGGPDSARTRLENFWTANCANAPGEKLLNDMVQWMGGLAQVDLKLSPYLFPLRDIETAATATWPMLARAWPPLGSWMRGHYFQLRESVAPHVDFDLVGAIGDFCSIPVEVKRWLACELEARLGAGAERRERLRARQEEIAQDIRARLAAAPWIVAWTRDHDIAPEALLRAVFDAWQAPEVAFEPAALERLADAVRRATDAIPQLLIGAVDIDSGAFVAFSSERAADDAGITLDAVVASASLPWVFMAQTIQGTDPETHEKRHMSCWDGLFSQNPPIKNFISGSAGRTRKPDGIWILQINQDSYDFSKRVSQAGAQSGDELWHRRDTLSGNLSLNQEVAFIEAVNARLDDPGQRARARDKPIEVVRIVMDGAAVGASARRDMGLFSKFDRDPGLAQALLAHGREQARRYLALRNQSGTLWEALARDFGAIGARPSARMEQARPYMAGRERLVGGLVAPDVITVEGGGQATLRWHASEAVLDGRTLRIKGSTLLRMDDGAWRLDATRLLDVEQRGPQPAAHPGPAARTRPETPWSVAGQQRPDEGSGETLH